MLAAPTWNRCQGSPSVRIGRCGCQGLAAAKTRSPRRDLAMRLRSVVALWRRCGLPAPLGCGNGCCSVVFVEDREELCRSTPGPSALAGDGRRHCSKSREIARMVRIASPRRPVSSNRSTRRSRNFAAFMCRRTRHTSQFTTGTTQYFVTSSLPREATHQFIRSIPISLRLNIGLAGFRQVWTMILMFSSEVLRGTHVCHSATA